MLISDWSSDVCSSDLASDRPSHPLVGQEPLLCPDRHAGAGRGRAMGSALDADRCAARPVRRAGRDPHLLSGTGATDRRRSEEHTSELQSLMRISYAVFCLKTKISFLSSSRLTVPHFN